MHRSSIGGQLNYAALAKLHMPTSTKHLHAEIRRLHEEQALTANDIATALRVDQAMVINVLAKTLQPRGVVEVG